MEVNPRLAKRPLIINGRLANRGLTSIVKEATAGCSVRKWEHSIVLKRSLLTPFLVTDLLIRHIVIRQVRTNISRQKWIFGTGIVWYASQNTGMYKSINPSLGICIFTSWNMAWYQWIMDVCVYLNTDFENIHQLWYYELFFHVCYFFIYRGVMKPFIFIFSTKYYWHVIDGLALLLWSNLKGINTSTYPREYTLRYKR